MGTQTDDYGRVSAPFEIRLTNDARCATAAFQADSTIGSATGRRCTRLAYDEGTFSFADALDEPDNIDGTQRVLTIEQAAGTIETHGATEVGVFAAIRGHIKGATLIQPSLETPPRGERAHGPLYYELAQAALNAPTQKEQEYMVGRICDLRPKTWLDFDLRCSWGGIEAEVRRPEIHDNPHDPYRLLPTTRIDPFQWERHFEGQQDSSAGGIKVDLFAQDGPVLRRDWSLAFTRARMPHLSIRQDSTHVTPIVRLQMEADPVGVEDLDIDIRIEGYVVFRPGRPEQRR